MMMGGVDGILFSFIPIIVMLGFVVVFGIIIFAIITRVKTGIKNNNSPRLSVPAKVKGKRIHVRGDHSHTTYYVTFEVQSGDRMEFKVTGEEYGILAEEDLGILTFQGTRFISFERQVY